MGTPPSTPDAIACGRISPPMSRCQRRGAIRVPPRCDSMHAFALRAERALDGRPKCCHAPLADTLAPRRNRLRLSERHLGDAVTGDDVAVRQQIARRVRVLIVKIFVTPVPRTELLFQRLPVPYRREERVQRVGVVE